MFFISFYPAMRIKATAYYIMRPVLPTNFFQRGCAIAKSALTWYYSILYGGAFMPDYQKMYAKLFNASTYVIAILQQAQRDSENLFIEADDTPIKPFPKDDLPKDDE